MCDKVLKGILFIIVTPFVLVYQLIILAVKWVWRLLVYMTHCLGKVLKFLWDYVVAPVVDCLTPVFKFIVESIIVPLAKGVWWLIKAPFVYVLIPVFKCLTSGGHVKRALKWIWSKIIEPILDFIFEGLVKIFMWIYKAVRFIGS